MRRVTSATACRACIQNLNYQLRTPMPSVSNVQNGLDTSQRLQLHKLNLTKVQNAVSFTLFSPPSHYHPFQNRQPCRHRNLMAPLPTLFLFFQVTPRCVALPVRFLFTTLQLVLILAFFSLHHFSPPYTRSPIPPCYSLSIADLIFLPSSILEPLLRYEYMNIRSSLHPDCNHEGEVCSHT